MNLGAISDRFAEMHQAREAALALCRKIIQLSSQSIRCLHRGEFEPAKTHLDQARAHVDSARAQLQGTPNLYYTGFLQDAEKEYVEAATLECFLDHGNLPEMDALGVSPATYAHGVGEAASELRRSILDCLRKKQFNEAEALFEQMEFVLDFLQTLDFPDGLTGGLRRTTDALRAVTERTRSDLTLTKIQSELLTVLEEKTP